VSDSPQCPLQVSDSEGTCQASPGDTLWLIVTWYSAITAYNLSISAFLIAGLGRIMSSSSRRPNFIMADGPGSARQLMSAGMGVWHCYSPSMFVLILAAWRSANVPWLRLCGTIAQGRHVCGGQALPILELRCSTCLAAVQTRTRRCTWFRSPTSWADCLLCPLEILGRSLTPCETGRQHAMSMASVTRMASRDRAATSFTSTHGPWFGRQTTTLLLNDQSDGPLPCAIQ